MILYKQDVVNKLAEKTGLYKKDIKAVLAAFNDLVYEEIDADNSILITNLFKIEPVMIGVRKRYSIFNDEKYYINEEHKSVKIIPSSNLTGSLRKQNLKNDNK